MDSKVYLKRVEEYKNEDVAQAYKEILIDTQLLDFATPGKKVAIKANLVAAATPESSITVHPILLEELIKILLQRGCKVILGDSPGGMFNDLILNPIYKKLGLIEMSKKLGFELNHNYKSHIVHSNQFTVVKNLDVSDWLEEVDYIINFAKLKSHGMMSLSNTTKNMFGSVPGPIKLEYHYKYPNHNDFAKMLVDIQEYYKPVLHISDAIMAMEGNGPTQGKPKKVGFIMASKNPYNIDIVACKLIGLDTVHVPYIQNAFERGLGQEKYGDIQCNLDCDNYIVHDFKRIENKESIQFFAGTKLAIIGRLVKIFMKTKPICKKKECIGCKKCYNICPAHAITMVKGKPHIDRKKCIKCFCCQEFCPVGSMKTHHTIISRIMSK